MLNYIILLRLPKHEIYDAWVGGHAFLKNSSGNPEVHLPLFEGRLSPWLEVLMISLFA